MTRSPRIVTLVLCLLPFAACRRESSPGTSTSAVADPVPVPVPSSSDPTPPAVSSTDIEALREHVVRSHSEKGPQSYARSPEEFSKSMKGYVRCGRRPCVAGKEVCVVSPSPTYDGHCEAISEWLSHRTPRPANGFPPLAGITACSGSHNCPPGTLCCLHELGNAEAQAVVCHASLDECRDGEEICVEGMLDNCRSPGTKCDSYHCVAK